MRVFVLHSCNVAIHTIRICICCADIPIVQISPFGGFYNSSWWLFPKLDSSSQSPSSVELQHQYANHPTCKVNRYLMYFEVSLSIKGPIVSDDELAAVIVIRSDLPSRMIRHYPTRTKRMACHIFTSLAPRSQLKPLQRIPGVYHLNRTMGKYCRDLPVQDEKGRFVQRF